MYEMKYPIKACMEVALFETIRTFDTQEEKEQAMMEYADQVMHRDYIVTEDGTILFCKHILFLR